MTSTEPFWIEPVWIDFRLHGNVWNPSGLVTNVHIHFSGTSPVHIQDWISETGIFSFGSVWFPSGPVPEWSRGDKSDRIRLNRFHNYSLNVSLVQAYVSLGAALILFHPSFFELHSINCVSETRYLDQPKKLNLVCYIYIHRCSEANCCCLVAWLTLL